MYSYIIGEVQGYEDGYLILENNGIGYQLATSSLSMSHFQVGQTYKVYTIYQPREDSANLYGFYSLEEKEMFLLLNRVSAVGPKVALSILSTLTVPQIRNAVLQSDASLIATAPGVGKKTASRILLELIDPIQRMGYLPSEENEAEAARVEASVAIEALVNLGFPKNEAERAVKSLDIENASLEEIIKFALRKLA